MDRIYFMLIIKHTQILRQVSQLIIREHNGRKTVKGTRLNLFRVSLDDRLIKISFSLHRTHLGAIYKIKVKHTRNEILLLLNVVDFQLRSGR